MRQICIMVIILNNVRHYINLLRTCDKLNIDEDGEDIHVQNDN